MYYKAELEYLLRVLERMHLKTCMVGPDLLPDSRIDMGVRYFLGLEVDARQLLEESRRHAKENTIYRLSDDFGCSYLFLMLPGLQADRGLLAGPYAKAEYTREWILELAERFSVPTGRVPLLEGCFANIPVFRDQTLLLTLFSTLGEVLWGGRDAFEIVDVDQELTGRPIVGQPAEESGEGILLRMKAMEQRYAYENELMEMVAQGRYHRAELMLAGFSQLAFEPRSADPVRNLKNYGIICNTLLRKAAERGGVHPVHLDNISAHFARKIEAVAGTDKGRTLMGEMVRAYCQLVRKHAAGSHSTPVQKTLAYIEADLSADLSLRALAEAQNLSAGYLSALFRKETGKTLTEYVTEQRMEAAARLLRTTRLQVQTVAQHCGLSDVNYFSKLFKRSFGMTPKQFRQQSSGRR